jgi:hypothetical protein
MTNNVHTVCVIVTLRPLYSETVWDPLTSDAAVFLIKIRN